MSNQGLKEKVNDVKQLYSSLDEHADDNELVKDFILGQSYSAIGEI
jgi:hypothetical protein